MKTLTITFFLITLLGTSTTVSAQASEKAAVLAAVQQFFDAMAARDAAATERVMMPEGRSVSFRTIDGRLVMRSSLNQDYIKRLPSGKEKLRERMWKPEVKIHGQIANVWTPYDFWIDGKLSHCGIDSFNMVKVDGQWKIAGGVYTVETPCKPSPLGPLKDHEASRK